MPKITSIDYKYTDENGNQQKLKCVFEVNSSGIFFVIIPDWLLENAQEIASNFYTSVHQPKTHYRIEGKQLIDVQNSVRQALIEYSKPEASSELVIRYVVSSQCAIWEMPDSTIVPNGHVADRVFALANGCPATRGNDGYGDWVKLRHELNANVRAQGGYSITIGAGVYEKITTIRGSSKKVIYKKADSEDETPNCPIYMLNSFQSFDLESSFGWPRHLTIEEMPYNKESAEFFYNMMIGVSGLALKLERFFEDKSKLMEFISTGQQLLPNLLPRHH